MNEQVFISYRREGGDITAKLICESLKNSGYTVYFVTSKPERLLMFENRFNDELHKILT